MSMTRTPATGRPRRLAVVVLAVMATSVVGLFSGTPANAAVTTTYSLSTTRVLAPHGYKLTMSVFGSSLSITLSRTVTTGHHPTQSHTWSFSLPAGGFTCTATLSSCTVNTGTSMGTAAGRAKNYGKIDMTFHPNHVAKTVQNKCPNGTVTGSTTTRTGNLTGPTNSFHFVSNTSFFGTINKSSLPTRVTKVVSNGKICPAGAFQCFPSLGLSASKFTSDFAFTSFSASRSLPNGLSSLYFSYTQGNASTTPASVSHSIFVFGLPTSAVTATKTLTKATVNAAGAGMITGTETVTRQGSLSTTTVHKCRTQSTSNDPISGNLTAHFDVVGALGVAGAKGSFSKTTKVA